MNNRRWGVYAIVAFLLALPLLVWRSSRVGKLLALLGGGIIGLMLLTRLCSLGLVMYAKVFTFTHLTHVASTLTMTENQLLSLQTRLTTLDTTLTTQSEHVAEDVRTKLLARLTAIEDTLTHLETATADLRQKQRALVKHRILEIKEQVALLHQPLTSLAIRSQLEEIIPGLTLLKPEEKTRFLNDLKDIGFDLDGKKQTLNTQWQDTQHYVSSSGSLLTSGTVVLFDEP